METNNGIGNGKPRFSFVKYIGAKGASGGGGGWRRRYIL